MSSNVAGHVSLGSLIRRTDSHLPTPGGRPPPHAPEPAGSSALRACSNPEHGRRVAPPRAGAFAIHVQIGRGAFARVHGGLGCTVVPSSLSGSPPLCGHPGRPTSAASPATECETHPTGRETPSLGLRRLLRAPLLLVEQNSCHGDLKSVEASPRETEI